MKDYSEVTATLPRRVGELSDLLHDKKYSKALHSTSSLVRDLCALIVWILIEGIETK